MMTRLKVVALATLAFSSLTAMKPAAAALFSKADLDSSKLVLVASPYGNNAHQLLIVEQVSNNRACWSESGNSPTTIDPLLTNFDFTGICGRSTDANGYSIRMGDQDLGMQYSLRVVQRDGDLLLLGVPNVARNAPEIQIGRAGGVTNGFAKLYLNPGWRLTRRVYNDQPLGHFYLTNDQPLNSAIAAAPAPLPTSVSPTRQTPLPQTPSLQTPSLPLPVSRPDTIITAGSTAASLPSRSSTSISIPVPQPESTSATGSIRPVLAPTPTATAPIGTIPVSKPKPSVPSGSSQAATSRRSPLKGKPIRVPLPAAASRPVLSPPEAMQPPVTQAPVTQAPITPLPAARPSVPQPQPTVSTTAPAAVKPGNFVVPTTTL